MSRGVQVYISRSRDPYVNLSVEHHLFERAAPDSVVLFLYTNRPCVVVGRNQNPWQEVNLRSLHQPGLHAGSGSGSGSGPVTATGCEEDAVWLVRRRSGGGAVFHDEGNVNYSVAGPRTGFDRRRHAEMVVRALHRLGTRGARVNERHDIVMDVETETDTGRGPEPYKISGSAYKLNGVRSLHHGTCLLSSPNLTRLSRFLRSPALPFLKGYGTESVRSKVRNVGLPNAAFEAAVVAEFRDMYESRGGPGEADSQIITDEDAREIPSVMEGYAELRSPKWTWMQTPKFTLSSIPPSAADASQQTRLPNPLPENAEVNIVVRHGQITEARVSGCATNLESLYLHEVTDWCQLVGGEIGRWLNDMLLCSPAKPEHGQ